ncbi:hypothetical protein [Geodermatophilus sabuli]|uniref:DUF4190 domain-containing protein n=1 Tax=Geodermatophilus sabuli TaxID=1564158 RepID=A0A285EFN7_9ACTN|nr:hypothetical protein [Geodermatophilus sabuli]MBB3083428.1 vacuolar-type H+-ATPase subunit I/STV1 [Geodermatophilus sabuli]SNX96851.1 hypothetical protein SAMN06893097_105191 [Geodermatophilus sabuli]
MYPQPGPPYYYPPPQFQPQPSNGLGTAGFVLGLLGTVLFWVPLVGFILAVLGIVFSAVGRAQGVQRGAPTGLAMAGLVLGIIGAVLFFAMLLAYA